MVTGIVWEDSPLVRAVTHGRTLVVDEADKAPLEVVGVLKGLVEDGEMLLADGRRLVDPRRHPGGFAEDGQGGDGDEDGDVLRVHPDFCMWVLANRPGFPFLGNNFYREVGDVFAPHVVGNPDPASELALLSAYAPGVVAAGDQEVLVRLVSAFAELRAMVEAGQLAYPYSTREAVAVARHLERYPRDGAVSALENVLACDSFDPQTRAALSGVFQSHGVPLPPDFPTYRGGGGGGDGAGIARASVRLAKEVALGKAERTENWRPSPPASPAGRR